VVVFGIADANGGWEEGTLTNAVPSDNSATWNYRNQASTTPWAGKPGLGMAGVDYYVEPLCSNTISSAGVFEMTLSTNHIEHWRTNGIVLGLWPSATSFSLCSREDSTPANRPCLIVYSSSDDMPQLQIAGTDQVVAYNTASITLDGTSTNLDGILRWTNSLTGGNGTVAASSSWSIPDIALSVGVNNILVSGTNANGASASDRITITRSQASMILDAACTSKDPDSTNTFWYNLSSGLTWTLTNGSPAGGSAFAIAGRDAAWKMICQDVTDKLTLSARAKSASTFSYRFYVKNLAAGTQTFTPSFFLRFRYGEDRVARIGSGHAVPAGTNWVYCTGTNTVTWSAVDTNYYRGVVFAMFFVDTAINTSYAFDQVEVCEVSHTAHHAPPLAQADVSSGASPLQLVFDARRSGDDGGFIAMYQWDFDGDGQWDLSGPGAVVTNTMPGCGAWNGRLAVTDDSGSTTINTFTVVAPLPTRPAGFNGYRNVSAQIRSLWLDGGSYGSGGAYWDRVTYWSTTLRGGSSPDIVREDKGTKIGATYYDEISGNAADLNGRLLYPDGTPRYLLLTMPGGITTTFANQLPDLALVRILAYLESGGGWNGSCAGHDFLSRGTYLAGRNWLADGGRYTGRGYPAYFPYPVQYHSEYSWPTARINSNGLGSAHFMVTGMTTMAKAYYNESSKIWKLEPAGQDANVEYTTEYVEPFDGGRTILPALTNHWGGYAYISTNSPIAGRQCGNYWHPEANANSYTWLYRCLNYAALRHEQIPMPLKTALTNGATVTSTGATEAVGDYQYHYYPLHLPATYATLRITLSNLSENCDLYAEAGSFPVSTYCLLSSTNSGTAAESITVTNPAATNWVVAVRGNHTNLNGATYTVHATWGGSPGDSDGDGLPDAWEAQYYGGTTNADPAAWASNGINTLLEAYVAGMNPTDPRARFLISGTTSALAKRVVEWATVSGRMYDVYFSTNLLLGFNLLTNVGSAGSYTDNLHQADGNIFYRLTVTLP
jgi:hypothetical protein